MKARTTQPRRNRAGFSLLEVMFSVVILFLVLAGSLSSYVLFRKGYTSASLLFTSSNQTSTTLEEIVFGRRHAGNDDRNHTYSLRGVDTDSIIFSQWGNGSWRLRYKYKDDSNTYTKIHYRAHHDEILNQRNRIMENVVDSTATLTADGIEISVTVEDTKGGKSSQSTMTTYVHFRN